MPALPGAKQWNASLVSYVQVSDWDFDNGGLILFSDGAIWSYEAEGPASGDQGGFVESGPNIAERASGSEIWERLTPDRWGEVWFDQPPGYPNWPTGWNGGQVWEYDREGPLNVARVGAGGDGAWRHVQNPVDEDEILFYPGQGSWVGPIIVNRQTRRWRTILTNTVSQDHWYRMDSNVVYGDGFLYWLQTPVVGGGTDLIRAPMSDLDDTVSLHHWDAPPFETVNTELIDLPGYLDTQYLINNYFAIAIDGDEIYLFRDGNIKDVRTTALSYNDPTARNHDMEFSVLQKFKIGEYELEVLMWHTMPRDWVGYGEASGAGTLFDNTVLCPNRDDLSLSRNTGNREDPVGMGQQALGVMAMEINDGWLYWGDWAPMGQWAFNTVSGSAVSICRIELTALDPETPIQHDVSNPAFEIITNATAPWEIDSGHYNTSSGTYIWSRGGAEPLLPFPDSNAITFDDDGNIWYKAMALRRDIYSSDWYGYGTRCIYKLTPSKDEITDLTVTFTGDELKGYSAVRQVPASISDLEVELS